MASSSASGSVTVTQPAKIEAKRYMLVMQDGTKKLSSLVNQLKALRAKVSVTKSEERNLVALRLGLYVAISFGSYR